MIAPMALFWAVKASAHQNNYTVAATPTLLIYASDINNRKIEYIYFLINVNNNHWIAGFFNFLKKTMRYG